MSKREVLAYAITHAPPGVKGGPYEAESGPPGEECDSLRDACRWPTTEADARECAVMYLEDHLSWCGDARVIRIVRARPSEAEPTQQPSEVTPARLRTIARRLESRQYGTSLAGYALGAGLRAAADLLGGEPGPDVHRDYTDGGRASPRVSLATYAEVVPSQQPSEASAVEVLRELVAWVDSKGGGFDAIIVRARRVLAASGPDPSEMVRAVETLREQAFRGPARRTAALEALLDTFDAYRKAGGKCAGYVPLAAQPDPGTLQHLRADLRDAVKERDEAESHAEMRARILTVRAEKAERERDDLLARINQAEHEARCRGAEAKELVRVLEVERDEAKRLHSEAEAQVACRNELRAQVAAAEGRFRAAEAERDTLRAELARLAAPGEDGGPWRAYGEPTDQELVDAFEHAYSNAPSVRTHATAIRTIYRLGVAHERARQQPEKGRATDEELVDLYRKIYETHGGLTIDVSHGDCRRAAVLAVAAHVRKERCLVAEAVGMGTGVTISRTSERVPGTTGMWDVYVTRRPDVPGEHYAYGVPTADVPATLARLLGEVSRG